MVNKGIMSYMILCMKKYLGERNLGSHGNLRDLVNRGELTVSY